VEILLHVLDFLKPKLCKVLAVLLHMRVQEISCGMIKLSLFPAILHQVGVPKLLLAITVVLGSQDSLFGQLVSVRVISLKLCVQLNLEGLGPFGQLFDAQVPLLLIKLSLLAVFGDFAILCHLSELLYMHGAGQRNHIV